MFGGGGGGFQASQGYGGGGFVPPEASMPPASQGLAGFINDGNRTQETPQGGAKAVAHTLTPVTIRMLQEGVQERRRNGMNMGPDESIRVNGRELHMLTLVACVEGMQMQQLGMALTLNDGTGRMECQMYADTDSVSTGPDFQVGDYIRVFGHLRYWNDEDRITAHRIAKIENANEISHHTIEVTHVHMSLLGKLVKASGSKPTQMPATPQQASGAMRFAGNTPQSTAYGAASHTMQATEQTLPVQQNLQQQFHQPMAGGHGPQQQVQQGLYGQPMGVPQHQQAMGQSLQQGAHQGMQHQGMQQGMHQQGLPQQGLPQQGVPQQGAQQGGMPPQGMPHNGMPPQNGQPPQQHMQMQHGMQPQQGMQQGGMPLQQGGPQHGLPPQGGQQPGQMGFGGVPSGGQASPFSGGQGFSTGPPPGGAGGSHFGGCNNFYANAPFR